MNNAKPKSRHGGPRPNSGGARPGAGRKPMPVEDRQRDISVTMTARHMEIARRLGSGNASAGIRRALELAGGE